LAAGVLASGGHVSVKEGTVVMVETANNVSVDMP